MHALSLSLCLGLAPAPAEPAPAPLEPETPASVDDGADGVPATLSGQPLPVVQPAPPLSAPAVPARNPPAPAGPVAVGSAAKKSTTSGKVATSCSAPVPGRDQARVAAGSSCTGTRAATRGVLLGTKPSLTLGIQSWSRGETWLHPDFQPSRVYEGALLQRTRIQALGSFGPVSAFVQVQDARLWGTRDQAGALWLHQGYFQLAKESRNERWAGMVRVGRQEIDYGLSRLIGHLPWGLAARSFDGVRLRGSFRRRFGLDAFAVWLDSHQDFEHPSGRRIRNDGSSLSAVQIFAQPHPLAHIELLGLYLRERATESQPDNDRAIGNADLHVSGHWDGIYYDAEGSAQFGEARGLSHRAWAWAAFAGYTFDHDAQPGIRAGYAMASGDRCSGAPTEPGESLAGCGNNRSGEFYNFFPTNHLHYGFADRIGWRNMRDLDIRAYVNPIPEMELILAYHHLQLHEADGPWKNASGSLLGTGFNPQNRNHTLGNEFDVELTFHPWPSVMIQPGYAMFMPGAGARNLGASVAQHFVWLWMVIDLSWPLR